MKGRSRAGDAASLASTRAAEPPRAAAFFWGPLVPSGAPAARDLRDSREPSDSIPRALQMVEFSDSARKWLLPSLRERFTLY